MAILNVPSTDYPTIRAAITAAASNDQIDIDPGTYDIRDVFAVGDLLGPSTFSYTTNINCMTGFDPVTTLSYFSAGGSTQTFITGNPRLFVSNQDGVAPVEITFTGMEMQYNNNASNYILQTGNFGVSEANTITNNIFLSDVRFTGQHVGNASANGNYSAVLGIEKFSMLMCKVSLTSQSSFTGTQAMSGGSSFLMLQGGAGTVDDPGFIAISETDFDESGYRNGLSIFDSYNVGISQTKFYRSDSTTRYARSRLVNGNDLINIGNKISNSQGSLSGNHFFDGSYLVIEKTVADPALQLAITGTHFAQFDPDITVTPTPPNPIIGGGAVGIVVQGAEAATAIQSTSTTFYGNTFSYVSPINNLNTTQFSVIGGQNTFINPVNNSGNISVGRYIAGGTTGETLNGTSNAEVFIPGLGTDIVNTGVTSNINGTDYVILNTAPGTGNVDTITNFNRLNQTSTSATTAWDRLILDRKFFPNITAHYASNATGVVGGIGAVSSSNIENNTTGVATLANTRLVYQTTNGALFYDQDGLGGAAGVQIATLLRDTTNPILVGLVGFTNAATIGNVNVAMI
ncbi:MAG: hypothetical protein ACK6BG_10605 [Cyanobacteriota bacterium]